VATEVAGEQLARLSQYGSIHLLDEVESTSDYAFGLASEHKPAVVLAGRQTKGRGRFRRPWLSDEDSLTASLLLFTDAPDFPHPSFLTHLAGLALCRAIKEVTGLQTQIRWPNDITCSEKKLAGILCESRKNAVAVGVGLNVNQQSFPEDLPEAGSLRLATGRTWDSMVLLEGFLREMLDGIRRAGKGETARILADIKERSAVMHRRVEVKTLLRRHVGTVIDIDSEGRIVLRSDSGRLVVLDAGDVRRLR
jgi:BirA family biotin operon repressor/biotin-[acetyl-CoA-carboxylase] ligase